MVDISTWCCDHLKGLHNYWRYLKQASGFGGRRGPAETSACAHGAVLQRDGWPMLGGCVQQTARLLSFLQSAAERHGGGVKSAQPWLREQAALLLLGSAVSAHTSTAAMLKFFSGRDDENESLLEAVTEGKSWGQRGIDASLLDYLLQDDSAGLCWLSRKRWYSIYLCAQTASAETRALTRFLRLPGGDQWVPPPQSVRPGGSAVSGCKAECRIAAGLHQYEPIKHLHVWRMRHRPGKRALQSAASVMPRRLFGEYETT